ncbi:MAG: BlaI family transcriptional regulator [Candidatus Hydrogenedentota bacterium]
MRQSVESLGELQRSVMEAIWDLGEATVHEVRDRLAKKKPLAYTTILSTMQKLEKAGWLKHRADGRMHVFRATRSREEVGMGAMKRLVSRAFKGDPLLMFQHLLEDEKLTAEDLAEMRAMIDARRKRGRDGK